MNKYFSFTLTSIGAWILALLWISPLVFAFWAAFHSSSDAISFDLFSPLTLDNFIEVWQQAPFPQYMWNTFILVTGLLISQCVLATLAAFAFARMNFIGGGVAFALVLMQLMVTPEILIVENYATVAAMGFADSLVGIGLPYAASAFGIFLLRQSFKSIPKELDDAALRHRPDQRRAVPGAGAPLAG